MYKRQIAMYQMRIAKYKEYTNYKTDEEILTLTNKEEELSNCLLYTSIGVSDTSVKNGISHRESCYIILETTHCIT